MKTIEILWQFIYRLIVLGLFVFFCYLAFIKNPSNEQIMDAIFIGAALIFIRINDMVDQIKKDLE